MADNDPSAPWQGRKWRKRNLSGTICFGAPVEDVSSPCAFSTSNPSRLSYSGFAEVDCTGLINEATQASYSDCADVDPDGTTNVVNIVNPLPDGSFGAPDGYKPTRTLTQYTITGSGCSQGNLAGGSDYFFVYTTGSASEELEDEQTFDDALRAASECEREECEPPDPAPPCFACPYELPLTPSGCVVRGDSAVAWCTTLSLTEPESTAAITFTAQTSSVALLLDGLSPGTWRVSIFYLQDAIVSGTPTCDSLEDVTLAGEPVEIDVEIDLEIEEGVTTAVLAKDSSDCCVAAAGHPVIEGGAALELPIKAGFVTTFAGCSIERIGD